MVAEKFQSLLIALKLTPEEFSEQIGVGKSSVYKLLRGETKSITLNMARKISNQFDYSIEYLLSFNKSNNDIGVGERYFEESGKNDTIKEPEAIWVNYERFMLVPMVSHRAQAGFLSGWGDDEYLDELPKVPWEVDKEYKGKYMTFEVSGESMESEDDPRDSLYEGDLLLCREVMRQHWKNKLHIHKWDFVIVHREQGILAKRITHHDTDKGIITLHSLNPYYEDQKVSLDDLIAIFNIIDVKRSRKRR
ncbi:MAG: hypothetical protein Tsb0033_27460 [Winogradskyella sp.]